MNGVGILERYGGGVRVEGAGELGKCMPVRYCTRRFVIMQALEVHSSIYCKGFLDMSMGIIHYPNSRARKYASHAVHVHLRVS